MQKKKERVKKTHAERERKIYAERERVRESQ